MKLDLLVEAIDFALFLGEKGFATSTDFETQLILDYLPRFTEFCHSMFEAFLMTLSDICIFIQEIYKVMSIEISIMS